MGAAPKPTVRMYPPPSVRVLAEGVGPEEHGVETTRLEFSDLPYNGLKVPTEAEPP